MKEYEQKEKGENEAKEPEVEFMESPLLMEDEYDLEDSESFEQIKEELESVFEEDRIKHDGIKKRSNPHFCQCGLLRFARNPKAHQPTGGNDIPVTALIL